MGMAEASLLSLSAVSSSLFFFVDSARWREGTFKKVAAEFSWHKNSVVWPLQWLDMYESLITFKIGLKDGEGMRVEVGHGGGGQGDQPLQLRPGDAGCPLARCGRVRCEHGHWRQFRPEQQVSLKITSKILQARISNKPRKGSNGRPGCAQRGRVPVMGSHGGKEEEKSSSWGGWGVSCASQYCSTCHLDGQAGDHIL